jgi:hypothetical protein
MQRMMIKRQTGRRQSYVWRILVQDKEAKDHFHQKLEEAAKDCPPRTARQA